MKKVVFLVILALYLQIISFAGTVNVVDLRYTNLEKSEYDTLIYNQQKINVKNNSEQRLFIAKSDSDIKIAKQIASLYSFEYKSYLYISFINEAKFDYERTPVNGVTEDFENLNFYKSFEYTIPLMQFIPHTFKGLTEADTSLLVFVADDIENFALTRLPAFLDIASTADYPCSIAIPETLPEKAPALFQLIIAKTRRSSVELITLNAQKPIEQFGVYNLTLPHLGNRSNDIRQLKKNLKNTADTSKNRAYFVYTLNPDTMNTADLTSVLREINAFITPITVSQMNLNVSEFNILKNRENRPLLSQIKIQDPILQNKEEYINDYTPLVVSASANSTAIAEMRFIYLFPNGKSGAVKAQKAENGLWIGIIPPSLSGGYIDIQARGLDTSGAAMTSSIATFSIETVDSDYDGLADTLEKYLGTNTNMVDTDGDGLSDYLDPEPTEYTRMTSDLLSPIYPSADKLYLASQIKSSVQNDFRIISAGGYAIYAIPLNTFPRTGDVTLRVLTKGSGKIETITTNNTRINFATIANENINSTDIYDFNDIVSTDISIKSDKLNNNYLVFRVSSNDDEPLELYSFEILTNNDGPYIVASNMFPNSPIAGINVVITAMIYPHAESASIWWGTELDNLTETKMVQDPNGYTWRGLLPDNIPSGSLVAYTISAVDGKGNKLSSPFKMFPIGTSYKETITLQANRDFIGDFLPARSFNGSARAPIENSDTDTASLSLTNGQYHMWILADVSEKPLIVSVIDSQKRELWRGNTAENKTGWIYLGKFNVDKSVDTTIKISTTNAKGTASYASLIVTKSESFYAPVPTPFDWHDSVRILGVSNNQTFKVSDTINIRVDVTGNIDGTSVFLRPANVNHERSDKKFTSNANRMYSLSTRGLTKGNYVIYAFGTKNVLINGKRDNMPMTGVTIPITIE